MNWGTLLFELHCGDCVEVMPTMPAGSVDAIVTDPPYGLEFMGKEWDRLDGQFGKPGIGDRKTEWPSFGGDAFAGYNPTCATCGGRARGKRKCECVEPDWRIKGKGIDRRQPGDATFHPSGVGPFDRAKVRYGYGSFGPPMQEWHYRWALQAIRVLKPGGYMLVFGGTRTYHRLACAVEDAGFEIRDCIMWLYGSGFPKAKSCLKPAWEPILLCRRPGPTALPLGIDECRIDGQPWTKQDGESGAGFKTGKFCGSMGLGEATQKNGLRQSSVGRWPANVAHDGSEEVLETFPDAPGQFADVSFSAPSPKTNGIYGPMKREGEPSQERRYDDQGGTSFAAKPGARRLDSGSAARFFYCAKASRRERGKGNDHPTVKPLALMQWLVRLACPPGGSVLDPFTGSGTTGKASLKSGRRFIGIEREGKYAAIAKRRLAGVSFHADLF